MDPRTFDVSFHPPAMAKHEPIQLTGPGQIVVTQAGIEVTGAKVATRGRTAVVVLGFCVGFVAMCTIGIKFSINVELLVGVGFVVGAVALSFLNKIPLKPGESMTYSYAWSSVSRVTRDGASLLVVIKKAKPKGGLYIEVPPGSELERTLNTTLYRRS